MISVFEAQKLILASAERLTSYSSPVLNVQKHYLAEDILSDRDLPAFKKAMMDGFAIRYSDTVEHKVFNIIKTIGAGEPVDDHLGAGESVQIMTGAVVPEDADCIIPVEDAKIDQNKVSFSDIKIKEGMHVTPQGRDSKQGTILLKKGVAINAAVTAVCASVGKADVRVFRKPEVRIVSTGTEIVPAYQTPLDYQIRDGNSFALRSLCMETCVPVELAGQSADNPDELKSLIKEGLDRDILILSGGVSMGEFDLVPSILKELGVKEVFHKARLKPGKPVWYGKHEKGCYVFGLPGNPVSAQMNFKLFVDPLIKKLSGASDCLPFHIDLPFKGERKNRKKQDLYFPVQIIREYNRQVIVPIEYSGSADFTAISESIGMALIPESMDEAGTGDILSVLPWSSL